MEKKNVVEFETWPEFACFILFVQAISEAAADLFHISDWILRPQHSPSAVTVLASLTMALIYAVAWYWFDRRNRTPAPGRDLR